MKIVVFTIAKDISDEVIHAALLKIGETIGENHIKGKILNERDLMEIIAKDTFMAPKVEVKELAELLNSINNDFDIISAVAFLSDPHQDDVPLEAQTNIWKSLTSKRVGSLHISKIRNFVKNIETLKMDKTTGYGDALRQTLASNSSFYLIYDICKKIISLLAMGKTYKDLTRIPKKDHTLNESFKYKKKRHVKLEPYSRKRAVSE